MAVLMFTGSLLSIAFLMLTSSFLCRPVTLETSLNSTFSFHKGKLNLLLSDLVKENPAFTKRLIPKQLSFAYMLNNDSVQKSVCDTGKISIFVI